MSEKELDEYSMPDISNYALYPKFLDQEVITFNTLLSFFLGEWLEFYHDQKLIWHLRDRAFDDMINRLVPFVSFDEILVLSKDFLEWTLWLFLEGAIPCDNMKEFLNEYHKFYSEVPYLIAEEVYNHKTIQMLLKNEQTVSEVDSFKNNRELMEIIEQHSLANMFKEIYMIEGDTKDPSYRKDTLRKRVIDQLRHLYRQKRRAN